MTADRDTSKEALKGRTCSKGKWHWGRVSACGKPAKVIEGGEAFCGIHDPERDRKRNAANAAKWAEERRQSDDRRRKREADARKVERYGRAVGLLYLLISCGDSRRAGVEERVEAFLAEEPK